MLYRPIFTRFVPQPSSFCFKGRVLRGAYRFQAVITTFEMILGGCPELNAIEWRCVIIDEAHRLKNKNCKLLEGFKLMNLVNNPPAHNPSVCHKKCFLQLSVNTHDSFQEHKVLLTGTPLQNTVEELFSLLHFLEPARFPSENTFMQEFGDLKTEEQVSLWIHGEYALKHFRVNKHAV